DSTLNIITPSVVRETINQPDPTPNIVTSPVVKEVIKQPDSTPNIVTTPVVKEVINHPVPDISVENTNNERNVNKMESSLEIRYADKNDVFLAPGEAFNVMVSTQQDAYVYCYFEDQKGEVTRFFPNRFNSEPYVLHSKPLILPGESQFNLNASEDGVSERLACFSTDQNVINQLPPEIFGTDFEKLPVKSLEEVKALYIKMNTIEVSDYFFDIRVY
ncbi:MAG: DUF4384 domain-containing protein, partial [Gammaproteobacteria bacterium]|nr:DUF4384 domain-containing protein [Gammaproteobacteria bacterium]